MSFEIRVVEGGWGQAGPTDIRAVLESAAVTMSRNLADGFDGHVYVMHDATGPRFVTKGHRLAGNLIELNVTDRDWCRFAFQFAHEFCHFLAGSQDELQQHRWLEESLCEMASLFALRRMSEDWKTDAPYPNWRGFAPAIATYIQHRMDNDAEDLKDANFATWFPANKEALQKDPELRAKNLVIAKEVLPLMEKNPKGWAAMSHIHSKPDEATLEAHLLAWYKRTPDGPKDFVRGVGELLGVKLA